MNTNEIIMLVSIAALFGAAIGYYFSSAFVVQSRIDEKKRFYEDEIKRLSSLIDEYNKRQDLTYSQKKQYIGYHDEQLSIARYKLAAVSEIKTHP